ncbi:MAG: trypsin-like peptidase domain-containing protein [Gemmatimonadota bacterium]
MKPRYLLALLALALDPARIASQARRPTDPGASRRTAIVTAAARAAPGVVSVSVLKREQAQPQDPFAFFFMPQDRQVQGYGSGFIVAPDGVIITNQHVTAGAQQIVVTTRDGRDFPARVLGEDPQTDIAVLKVDASGLPTVPIGSSENLMIGEWVVAIGNPYAYLLGNSEPSVTAGVVSAVGRNLLPSQDQAGVYVGMIQTDASINPGNSGGPLVNAAGEVVGVNSNIFSNTGGSVGIGFAIPIERAIRVATELQRYGRVRRAWVGLDVSGATEMRGWKQAGGLQITTVAPGGPAARAGIAAGDVLVGARGQRLRTFLDWDAVLLDAGPGDTLAVSCRCAGRSRIVQLVVTDLPTSSAEKIAILGDIRVITLTPAIRQERDIQVTQGVLIYDIGDDTRRATGLAPGDVVFQVNRQRVGSAESLRAAFAQAAGGQAITLWFERGGMVGRTSFYVQ